LCKLVGSRKHVAVDAILVIVVIIVIVIILIIVLEEGGIVHVCQELGFRCGLIEAIVGWGVVIY